MDEEAIQQIMASVGVLEQILRSGRSSLSDNVKRQMASTLNEMASRLVEFGERRRTAIPPMPEGTDLLWQLSNANPEAFVNYLRTVPDPALNNLLRNPGQLNSIVQHLTREFPQAQPEQIDGIRQADLQSSNIWGFNYDPRSGRLKVRFQRGPIYEYEGVPPYIFNIFQKGAVPAKTDGENQWGRWWIGKSPSLGASFFSLIKNGGYDYTRIA